jgi:hypothetical protein
MCPYHHIYVEELAFVGKIAMTLPGIMASTLDAITHQVEAEAEFQSLQDIIGNMRFNSVSILET